VFKTRDMPKNSIREQTKIINMETLEKNGCKFSDCLQFFCRFVHANEQMKVCTAELGDVLIFDGQNEHPSFQS